MSLTNRRSWLKKSLVASAVLATRPSLDLFAADYREIYNGKFARLHWNENPYGPSDSAKEAMKEAISIANYYPDEHIDNLKNKLALRYSLIKDNFLLTSGSTEVLSILGQYVGKMKREIITPSPSFPTLPMVGEMNGALIKTVPLTSDYQINLDAVLNSITSDTRLIFICNPNNPTSTEVETSSLRQFIAKVPSHILLCIDEAYIQYSKNGEDGSMVDLVSSYPNLIICRTFSKACGLAGMRVGYAIAQTETIEKMSSIYQGLEFCTNVLGVIAATATLNDTAFIQKVVNKNLEGREILKNSFEKWGVGHATSSTNFVYVESKYFDPAIKSKLEDHKIHITKWPSMKDHIRISIATPAEMQNFVNIAQKYLI